MMNTTGNQLAAHLRQVFFGGNWTASDMRTALKEIDHVKAVTRVDSLNTIAALVYHIGYYIETVLQVFEKNSLDAHDRFSYDHPPVRNEEDWLAMQEKLWQQAGQLATYVERMPEEKWQEPFFGEKYGSFYRNILGIIEHSHYHLGQITLIGKMLKNKPAAQDS